MTGVIPEWVYSKPCAGKWLVITLLSLVLLLLLGVNLHLAWTVERQRAFICSELGNETCGEVRQPLKISQR